MDKIMEQAMGILNKNMAYSTVKQAFEKENGNGTNDLKPNTNSGRSIANLMGNR